MIYFMIYEGDDKVSDDVADNSDSFNADTLSECWL